jgi:hypothetical protein
VGATLPVFLFTAISTIPYSNAATWLHAPPSLKEKVHFLVLYRSNGLLALPSGMYSILLMN